MTGRHLLTIVLLLVCWARVAVADDPPKPLPTTPTPPTQPPPAPTPPTPADGDAPKKDEAPKPTDPNAPTTPATNDPNAPSTPTNDPNAPPTPTNDSNAPPTPTNDPNAPPAPTNDPNAPTTGAPTTGARTTGAPAAAQGPTVVTGKVTDVLGRPVPNARVYVMPRRGRPIQTKTGKDGRYSVEVRSSGTHGVVIAIDKAHTFRTVLVVTGMSNTMDADIELDMEGGEVIKIEDKRRPTPKVQPKAKRKEAKSLPYSDEAMERDAWARAWLLLDVDERGTVTRLKLLKRPGYDLDKICIDEAFKLTFSPALDDAGRPMKTYMLWTFEWPSWGWLIQGNGTATKRPVDRSDMQAYQSNALVNAPVAGGKIGGTWATPTTAESAGTAFETSMGRVPCAGSGPLNLDLRNRAYRDCSQPDMSVAAALPWITRETAAAAVAELDNPDLVLVEEVQGSRVPTFVGAGITAALAVTAIVSIYKFRQSVDRIVDYSWQATIDPAAYQRQIEVRNKWEKRSLLFTAGAILSGGATLLIWHRNMPKKSFSVQPSEKGDGAQASFSMTW